MGRRKMIMRTRHWALLAAWVLLSSCAVSPTGRTQFIIISPDIIIETQPAIRPGLGAPFRDKAETQK